MSKSIKKGVASRVKARPLFGAKQGLHRIDPLKPRTLNRDGHKTQARMSSDNKNYPVMRMSQRKLEALASLVYLLDYDPLALLHFELVCGELNVDTATILHYQSKKHYDYYQAKAQEVHDNDAKL